MGGFGALYLGGRHPDVFAHVYAASPCCLAFVGDLAKDGARWKQAPRGWLRAMAMAFDTKIGPDVEAKPLRLPYVLGADGVVQEKPAVIRAWQAYLPLARLMRDPKPYRRLCSLGLEAGRQDEIPSVTFGAAAFSAELTRAKIAHDYTEFDGGHTDHTRARFETALIPFFAQGLATQERPGACARRKFPR